MKTDFPLQLLVACVIYASLSSSEITETFVELIIGDAGDYGSSVSATEDGGFLVCGSTVTYGSGSSLNTSIYVSKFNDDVVEYAFTIGGEGNDYANWIESTEDGGFILTGKTGSVYGYDSSLLLVKFDSTANIEWSVALCSDYLDGKSVKETSDGGFVVCGEGESLSKVIAKFGGNGESEWITQLNWSWKTSCDIVEGSDGYFISGSTAQSHGSAVMTKIFHNGSMDWVWSYGSYYGTRGYGIMITPDGGLIQTGYIVTGLDVEDLFLAKWNIEGEGEIELFVVFGDDRNERGYTIELTDNDGYIILGEVVGEVVGIEILLVNFDSHGVLQWAKTNTDVRGNENGRSVSKLINEGGFVITSSPLDDGVFISVVTKYGEGCGWETVSEKYSSSEFFALEPVLRNSKITVTHPSIPQVYLPNELTSSFDTTVTDFTPNMEYRCESPVCFGRTGDLECSSHGTCIGTNTCSCEENYYGVNCEVFECFGFLSNETNHDNNPDICSGNGECVDYDTCGNCFDDYFGEFCDVRYPLYYYKVIDYGGAGRALAEMEDGGFILGGWTKFFSSDVSNYDAIVMKFFVNGSIDWAISLGGIDLDMLRSIIVTNDNKGILLGAISNSFCPRGIKSFLVCKLSLLDGSVEWCSCVNGSGSDVMGYSIDETKMGDNGVIISGQSDSCGYINLLIVKLNSSGNLVWAVCVGGETKTYVGYSQIAADGGIIVGGRRVDGQMLLVRLNSDGTFDWAKVFSEGRRGFFLQNLDNDGGIITLWNTESLNVMISKFTSSGELEWSVTMGGLGIDFGHQVRKKKNGKGYLVLSVSTSITYTEYNLVLYSFDLNGNLEKVSTFGQPPLNLGAYLVVFLETNDGGVVISGCRIGDLGHQIFTMKTVDFDKGCCGIDYDGWRDITNTGIIEAEKITVISVQNWSPPCFFVNGTLVDQSFISPTSSVITNEVLASEREFCYYEFSCFGQINSSSACKGHGKCVDFDTCECDGKDGNTYFGNECEFHYCFGILNNDTTLGLLCGGRGKCVDHDVCDCFENYGYNEDCTLWKCFGVWMNDTEVVCNGNNKPDILISRGQCTSHDDCQCEEGYRRTTSCDWECQGFLNGDERACGGSEYGVCVDRDTCNCTTDMYVGKTCSTPTCAKIPKDDYDKVCDGHGECIDVDVCNCDAGYLSTEPGFCDYFTCFGVERSVKTTCSSKGDCVSYNDCDCHEGYTGDSCSLYVCGGFPSNDHESVCGGMGKCILPENCDCQFGYTGVNCDTPYGYLFVLVPSLFTLGILGIFVCLCVCLGCFLCLISLVLSILLSGGVIFSYKLQVRKYSKLQHFDLLLKEQLVENDPNIAHLRINKDLFKIPYSELKIERLIGEGGSNSIVYLAQWKKMTVAFKCYKTRFVCSSQNNFNEFEKEVQVSSSISHPHIIRFFGACMDPPRLGIVMEYCEKGECYEYVHEKYPSEFSKTYPFNQSVRILYETASALEYLHSRRVIHRDLKCENVFLNKYEESKVADFGLSKIMSGFLDKNMTYRIGTQVYMSPELTLGLSNYTNAVDIYSFGIMAYILLSGDMFPYGNPTPYGIEYKVANNENYRPRFSDHTDCDSNSFIKKDQKKISRWIVEVAEQCWKGDPDERPSFLEILEVFRKNNDEEEDKKTEICN